jgi:hypothetical protein
MNQNAAGYAVSALLGAFVVTLAGYFAFASAHPGIPLSYWMNHPLRFGAAWWIIAGIVVGAAVRWLTLSRAK